MKRIIATLAAVLLTWSAGANFASAQFGTLGQPPLRPRPTVSPFIGLGSSGALGYYGLIKPQMDAQRQITDLQNNLMRVNPDGTITIDPQKAGTPTSGLQTGHAATYFNYSHYYPLTPTGGASSSLGAGSTLGLGGFGGYAGPASTTGFGVGTFGGAGGSRTFFGATFGR